jgi:hypothetical protein
LFLKGHGTHEIIGEKCFETVSRVSRQKKDVYTCNSDHPFSIWLRRERGLMKIWFWDELSNAETSIKE